MSYNLVDAYSKNYLTKPHMMSVPGIYGPTSDSKTPKHSRRKWAATSYLQYNAVML